LHRLDAENPERLPFGTADFLGSAPELLTDMNQTNSFRTLMETASFPSSIRPHFSRQRADTYMIKISKI
jgi:hypothetical protein